MVRSIYARISGVGIVCALLLLALVVIAPAAARGDTIAEIESGDTVFVYEEGLDLSALRNETTDTPVTALVKYTDDDLDKGEINRISVPDETDFDLDDADVGEYTGLYYAYSKEDNARTGKRIMVRYPEVRIEPVLAAPNHADRIEGITIPTGTAIAFKVIGSYVGTQYVAGDEHASVDIVVTTPGGAELTTFEGRDLTDLPLTASNFYTDDPGMPGPIRLEGLEEGKYKVQARWHSPQGFADYAEDSNIITIYSGERIGVNTPLPTPTVTTVTTPTTTVTGTPTAAPTTAVPTETTAETTVSETSVPETTTTVPATTPAPTPLTLIPVFAALLLGILVMTRE
ncbi:DUF3821 domain-containing protein [Methanofollis formosanus]|uniref:DUF3821 domain-containing protein n=1 Tax=Methanofollis formosanus TaxID=299308 RepID=A0A8G1A0G4_9EURY|nr:DUF3821 domain-containing protein [Methanofollis formosanus]QYZ78280.1 DUF3821 domain-containing protein [Methanofollis formosanus]